MMKISLGRASTEIDAEAIVRNTKLPAPFRNQEGKEIGKIVKLVSIHERLIGSVELNEGVLLDEIKPSEQVLSNFSLHDYEWQFEGDDSYSFGRKVRGIVRRPIAQVYFNEESNDRNGGWIWLTLPDHPVKMASPRGTAYTLGLAVEDAEEALVEWYKLPEDERVAR